MRRRNSILFAALAMLALVGLLLTFTLPASSPNVLDETTTLSSSTSLPKSRHTLDDVAEHDDNNNEVKQHHNDDTQQADQQSTNTPSSAIFTYVRRKDLRNETLRQHFWRHHQLKSRVCQRCGFDCITEIEPRELVVPADVEEEEHREIADPRMRRRKAFDGGATNARHRRQLRARSFFKGKWEMLRDLLPRYERVLVVPHDAFLMLTASSSSSCQRLFRPLERDSDDDVDAVNDGDDHHLPADAAFTVDWRGHPVTGAIFYLRNTPAMVRLLQRLVSSGRYLHEGGAVDRTSSAVTLLRGVELVLTSTSSQQSCFYCAEEADDALARSIISTLAREASSPKHNASTISSSSSLVREHLVEFANSLVDQTRVRIATQHRSFNSYVYPCDSGHPPFRFQKGDLVGRFPRCATFAGDTCFTAARRLYFLAASAYGGGDAVAPQVEDSQVMLDTGLAERLGTSSSGAWRHRPLFLSSPEQGKKKKQQKKQEAPSLSQLHVPPSSRFDKRSPTDNAAVLIVICTSDPAALEMHRSTFASKLAYATLHRYDIIVDDCDAVSKGKAINSDWGGNLLSPRRWLLEQSDSRINYRYVLQFEPGTVVMNIKKSVRQLKRSFALAQPHRQDLIHKSKKKNNDGDDDDDADVDAVLFVSRDQSGEPSTGVMLWEAVDGKTQQVFDLIFDAANSPHCPHRLPQQRAATSPPAEESLRCALNHALSRQHSYDDKRHHDGKSQLAERLILVAPAGTRLLFGIPSAILKASGGDDDNSKGKNIKSEAYHRRSVGGRADNMWSRSQRESKRDLYRLQPYGGADFSALVRCPQKTSFGGSDTCAALVRELMLQSRSLVAFGSVDSNDVPLELLPKTVV